MQGRRRNQAGEALIEYGFAIAFVGVILTTAFAIANGTLFRVMSDSKTSCNNALVKAIAAGEEAGKRPE